MPNRIHRLGVTALLALALVLAACGPVPGSRPTATFGFARSPTPDLTQTTATPVPSDTPEPTETAAATDTPRPEDTATAEPTRRATAAEAVVDEPTPIATPAADAPLVAVIACEPAEDDFVLCADSVLGLSFEQPAAWGPITATLRQSFAGTGLAYDYLYAEMPVVNAGGRSADFTEGRGGMVTDFAGEGAMGFNGATPEAWCAALTASVCEVVQPEVVLGLRLPEAASLCDMPDFALQFAQQAYVWILLPDHPLIKGFVFVSPFLSDAAAEQVLDLRRDLLGWDDVTHTTCTPAAQAEFDAAVGDYLADLDAGDVDADTLEMVAGLRHLAESVAPLT